MTALLAALALCLAAPPARAFSPSATESAALAAGEVVLHPLPTEGSVVRVVGVADIRSSADAIWSALLDFPSRLQGNASLRSVSEYRPRTADEQWWRWEVSRFGVSVVYHNHYRLDRTAGTLLHELDPSQANDLAHSRGLYELTRSPADANAWRLSYTVESDFGRAIPGFVQQWLCGGGVRDFLTDLVTRAESG